MRNTPVDTREYYVARMLVSDAAYLRCRHARFFTKSQPEDSQCHKFFPLDEDLNNPWVRCGPPTLLLKSGDRVLACRPKPGPENAGVFTGFEDFNISLHVCLPCGE